MCKASDKEKKLITTQIKKNLVDIEVEAINVSDNFGMKERELVL